MLIPLERRGAKPVFRQIVDYLRQAIEAGRLEPGTKLEPIRVFAQQLGVNRETMADAYRELESLGLTESTVGRGTFVLARTADRRPVAPAPRPFVPILARAVEAAASRPVLDYSAAPDAVRLEGYRAPPRSSRSTTSARPSTRSCSATVERCSSTAIRTDMRDCAACSSTGSRASASRPTSTTSSSPAARRRAWPCRASLLRPR